MRWSERNSLKKKNNLHPETSHPAQLRLTALRYPTSNGGAARKVQLHATRCPWRKKTEGAIEWDSRR